MSDAVPVSLFLTRRALCPGCGAPLQLQADAILVECEYCGCESGVERRLRTLEAELHEGVNPADVARGRTRFIPAHAIAGDGHAEARCPGCGSAIGLQRAQDIAQCQHCGSKSKVERRLAPGTDDTCDDAALDEDLRAFVEKGREQWLEESRRRFKASGRDNPFEFEAISDDYLVMLLLTATDSEIIGRTSRLLGWSAYNNWRECMLTRLLLKAEASNPKVADVLFKHIDWACRADSLFGKHRQSAIRSVVRSAARVFYRPDVSEQLMYTLGTSHPNAMVKLLLDVAEWGLEHGHQQAAKGALNAAARILDKRERMYQVSRTKVDPVHLAGVILYRLLYMRPELVAWALEQVPRWQLKDYRILVRFIDDCTFERPDLIAAIRDARIVKQEPATTFREVVEHLDFLDGLLTPQAREYGMYLFTYRQGKTDAEPELLPPILTRLSAMLDEPALRKLAAWELSRIVTSAVRQGLSEAHAFMRAHGDKLPAVVWWNYRKAAPGADIPTGMLFQLPYIPAEKYESELSRQLAQFSSGHEREFRYVGDEKRRVIAERESAETLALAEEKAKAAKDADEAWTPGPRALAYYRQLLSRLRAEGSAGVLHLASPYLYAIRNRMDFHRVEYAQTGDARYKDYIERHEAAYEMILEHARMKQARQEAEAYARKSWLGRLLHDWKLRRKRG